MLSIMMDIFGWFGATLLLIPYFLVSTGKVEGHSKYFQISNIMGGILLTANSYFYGALPSVLVNLVWIAIGVLTLSKLNLAKETNNV